ncbi:MAG: aminopeptidase [Candidatus Aminicenantes bacterium]|nr:aminopeptidase [Candidatus Aminicenantes bacterium]
MLSEGKTKWICALVLAGLLLAPAVFSSDEENKVYQFTVVQKMEHTPVKNQARTGTCWCFSTVSFLESEALRLGGEVMDLSEMFIVNYNYRDKAKNYIRMHGNASFGQGSLSHDVMKQLREHGIVPEAVYSGKKLGKENHDHSEMFRVLRGILDSVIAARRPSIRWLEAYTAALNVYLGTPPESFTYKGKTYTPSSFAREKVLVNPDDYVELTSYTYAPFYSQCMLKVPDNWWYNGEFYNVPLDELEHAADYALKNGFTITWDGDVSEKFFSSRDKGYALLPKEEIEREITEVVEEMVVTQANREETFNNYTTTDDHLMHFVGLAEDQNGKIYYYIKNSSGADRAYEGYLFMSKPYFRMKTTAIMVHKNGLPPELKVKLGLN